MPLKVPLYLRGSPSIDDQPSLSSGITTAVLYPTLGEFSQSKVADMLSTTRARVPAALTKWRQPLLVRYNSADNPVPANDPNPKPANQTVSDTNAMATSSVGSMDKTLQESAAEGEAKRVMQAPNRKSIWSRSQQLREQAMVGPRFEQMIVEDQVWPSPTLTWSLRRV